MTDRARGERLIVALDVPTVSHALRMVDALDNVECFKVGWQLFVTGEVPALLTRLNARRIFLDLKLPGDIDRTIRSVIGFCTASNVTFLTLSDSMPRAAVASAVAARGARPYPKLLTVPVLSSMNEEDLGPGAGDVNDYIRERARTAIAAGCDGVIASGQAIGVCRRQLGDSALIVSPGIRPAGASTDDHKRHTTPAEAMRLGADYLVVGRPILADPNPRAAAQRIIDEIDQAVGGRRDG